MFPCKSCQLWQPTPSRETESLKADVEIRNNELDEIEVGLCGRTDWMVVRLSENGNRISPNASNDDRLLTKADFSCSRFEHKPPKSKYVCSRCGSEKTLEDADYIVEYFIDGQIVGSCCRKPDERYQLCGLSSRKMINSH